MLPRASITANGKMENRKKGRTMRRAVKEGVNEGMKEGDGRYARPAGRISAGSRPYAASPSVI
jgi:hypothetical protein